MRYRKAFLLGFMSLPKGEWSKTVVQIMNAAIRDRVADIPMNFASETPDGRRDKCERLQRGYRRDFKRKRIRAGKQSEYCL